MEFKIIEKECTDRVHINSQPLSYRLKLYEHNDVLILQREYFRSGFNDMERWDKYWIVDSAHTLSWVSIITRNLDKEYLSSLEYKIFELYRESSERCSHLLKNDIQNYIRKTTKYIIKHDSITNFLDILDRTRKIEKIKKNMV